MPLKVNLLTRFSVVSFIIMAILAVVISQFLTARLDHNIELLQAHGKAMQAMMHPASPAPADMTHSPMQHTSRPPDPNMQGAMGHAKPGEAKKPNAIDATEAFSIPNLMKNVQQLQMLTYGIVGVGFAVLYTSLFLIVRHADRILRQQHSELQSAHNELERRVAERTLELSQANGQLTDEIAERKRAEEELQRFADDLQRSNRELQDFAYVASHDLQEPLRKIQAFGDRLSAKCGETLSEQGQDYLTRMQNAASRMQSLITDLLMFSRVATQAKPLEPIDLGQVVQEVVSDLEVYIEQVAGQVEVGELPTIDADPVQMRQLVQNLISNALKFHRPDTPPVVKIEARRFEDPAPPAQESLAPPALCQLTVADNGIGFDEKYLDRIFTVFQRLHGRSAYEGTGIGLAVCRKIVERHRGSITAQSRPDHGATFVVTLPYHHAQEKE